MPLRWTDVNAIARLEKVLPETGREAINAAAQALEHATKSFAEKRMDRGIRSALRGVTVDRLDGKT